MRIIMDIYVVKPGDTVASIAERFKLPYEKIVHDNNIIPEYGIVNGQIIILAYPKQTYIVKPGDTWKSIASDNGISVIQLLKNNPFLLDRTYLNEGEELIIDYERKENPIEVNAFVFSYINDAILKKTLPYLTYITIAGYRITPFSEIEAPNDAFVINTAKEYGVAPIMLLSTVSEQGKGSFGITNKILNDQALQTQLINNILALLREHEFYGINFGFINIIPSDLQNYINFIVRSKEILAKEGYQVQVSLVPKTFGFTEDETLDNTYFQQVGQVADRVILMSYTWASSYIPNFELTTIPFLRRYVQYAITQIPPEKISLGYTRIAYDWELPYVEGESDVTAIANSQALALASQFGMDLGFDEEQVTPYFRYYVDGIQHFVWFKDARTLDAILDIITEYNLVGISIWNTMDFTPQLWVTINSQYHVVKVLEPTATFLL